MGAEKTKLIDEKMVLVMKRKLLDRVLLKTKLLNLLGGSFLETLEPLLESAGMKIVNGKMTGADTAKEIKAKDIDLTKFIPAISHLLSTLDGDKLVELMKNLLKGVFVNERDVSVEETLEEVIGDDMMFLYKLIAFVVYCHFSSFFLNLSTTPLFKQVEKAKQKLTESSKDAGEDSTKS